MTTAWNKWFCYCRSEGKRNFKRSTKTKLILLPEVAKVTLSYNINSTLTEAWYNERKVSKTDEVPPKITLVRLIFILP